MALHGLNIPMSQASNYSGTMVLKHLVSGPLYILKKVIEDPNDYLYRLYLYLPFQIKTEIKKKNKTYGSTPVVRSIMLFHVMLPVENFTLHLWERVKKANNLSIIMKIAFTMWTSLKGEFPDYTLRTILELSLR